LSKGADQGLLSSASKICEQSFYGLIGGHVRVFLVLNFQVSLHLFSKSYEGAGWFSNKDVHAYIYARFLNQLHLSERGKSKSTQKAYASLSNAHDSSGNRIYMTKSEKDIIVTTFFACGLTGQLGSSK